MRVVGTAVIARVHLSIELSNFLQLQPCNHVHIGLPIPLNHTNWHFSSFLAQNGSDCKQVVI